MGEGDLPLVQLSIHEKNGLWQKETQHYLFLKQTIPQLVENCICGTIHNLAPCMYTAFSLHSPVGAGAKTSLSQVSKLALYY
jgi:hypothetical protein